MSRLIKSFKYAWDGVKLGAQARNYKVQVAIGMLVTFAGIFYKVSYFEWIAILLCFTAVLSLEMVNSALEELANVVRDELKLSYSATRKTRDLAAGAVLLAAGVSVLVGLEIFLPRLFKF